MYLICLQKVPLEITLKNVADIISALSTQCDHVVVLTLPPILKLENKQLVKSMNQFIRGVALEAGENYPSITFWHHNFKNTYFNTLQFFVLKILAFVAEKKNVYVLDINPLFLDSKGFLRHDMFEM